MVGQESRVKHFAERQIFLDMQELIENCTNLQWSRNLKYGDSDAKNLVANLAKFRCNAKI